MNVFVMYDISDTPTRSNFIKKLQFFGLKRIQKSVFYGVLDNDDKFDLIDSFELYLSSESDSIILIPVCKNCFDSIFIEGDFEFPNNNTSYVFF